MQNLRFNACRATERVKGSCNRPGRAGRPRSASAHHGPLARARWQPASTGKRTDAMQAALGRSAGRCSGQAAAHSRQQQQPHMPAATGGGGAAASTSGRSRQLVVCMAHPRRVAKVSSQIQREISEMFIRDKVVQEAICPERRLGLDDTLSAVASVTHVYVSNDLQVVKAYVSVYSDERGKQVAFDNLVRIAPYVRSRIGKALGLRLTPEVRFEYDDSQDELERIQRAIGQEDFDRYIAEGEAEAGGTSSTAAAAGAARVGYGAGDGADEDEDDDDGFFDIADADADVAGPGPGSADVAGPGPGSAAAAGQPAAVPRVSWSRHDPATFFAVDDEDEDEEEDAGGAWYSRRGPFDDLFSGGGEELATPKRQKQRRRGKGGGGGQQ